MTWQFFTSTVVTAIKTFKI